MLPSEPAEPSDQGGSNAQRGDDPMLDQGRPSSAYMSAPVPYCVIDPRKQDTTGVFGAKSVAHWRNGTFKGVRKNRLPG